MRTADRAENQGGPIVRPRLETLRFPCGRALKVAVLVAFWGATSPTGAQNLVVNGEFDSMVAPWLNFSATNGDVDWDPLDRDSDPESGSLLVTNFAPDPQANGAGAIQFNLPVTGLGYYSFGGAILIPTGQTVSADVMVELRFYQFHTVPSGCSGSHSGFWTPTIRTAPTWVSVRLGARAPAGATCARVVLETYADTVESNFRAHFDDVFVIEALFVDGFEFGGTGGWSATSS